MDFISDFMKATAHLPSPEHFRLWGALATVSMLMGRKLEGKFSPVYPTYGNQFLLFVAPSGGGKSTVIRAIKAIVRKWEGTAIRMSSDVDTPQNIMKELGLAFSGNDLHALSFNIFSGELAGLMPDPKEHFGRQWYQSLAQIWDNEDDFKKGTKTQDCDLAQDHYVNMIAGSQPALFARIFPPDINELGLPSRFIFLYSDEEVDTDYYAEPDNAALERCYQGAERLYGLKGIIRPDDEARECLQSLRRSLKPVNLENLSRSYLRRRMQHIEKFCMILAVATHPESLIVTLKDVERAVELLYGAEENMHKAAFYIGTTDSYHREIAVVEFVKEQVSRTGEPVPDVVVRERVMKDFPPNMRRAILENLTEMKLLKAVPGLPKRYTV